MINDLWKIFFIFVNFIFAALMSPLALRARGPVAAKKRRRGRGLFNHSTQPLRGRGSGLEVRDDR